MVVDWGCGTVTEISFLISTQIADCRGSCIIFAFHNGQSKTVWLHLGYRYNFRLPEVKRVFISSYLVHALKDHSDEHMAAGFIF